MYPDPSICRVGEDYYLVTSSLEYLPGIPIFHSRDLVHWEQIGHAIHRDSQLDMGNIHPLGGIYAPTIRHNNGVFYIISTIVAGQGLSSRNFYVHADDPKGPWSDPVFVNQSGIDPSLFIDDDGTVYLTSNRYGGGLPNSVIQQSTIDLDTGKILTEPRIIANGSGGVCTEAPHIYRRGNLYYLVCAEGGTALGHMVTVFRAKSPWGPFEEACPNNPILTARDSANAPLLATGHADFVTTQHGETWMVFLCYRHATSKYHHLGRETALLPVSWDNNDWPHVFGGKVALEHVYYPKTALLPSFISTENVQTDFTATALNYRWNMPRHIPTNYKLDPTHGTLTLHGSADSGVSLEIGPKTELVKPSTRI